MDLAKQQAHSNEDRLKECEKSYKEFKKMLEQQAISRQASSN